jgi:hypothetical protein
MSSHTGAFQELSLMVAADAGQKGMKATKIAMEHCSVARLASMDLSVKSGGSLMALPCLLVRKHDQIPVDVKISRKYLDRTGAGFGKRSVTN